jgi:hypothetical protein
MELMARGIHIAGAEKATGGKQAFEQSNVDV